MNPAALTWLAVLITAGVYDLIAYFTRTITLTDEVRSIQNRWHLFRWLILIGLGILWWHLFAYTFRN